MAKKATSIKKVKSVKEKVEELGIVDGKIDPNKKVKYKRFILKKYKLNASIGGYSTGAVIRVQCYRESGIPTERYWRRRLRDSEIDGCMELVE